ncbi:alpha/beta hydrolase, partial [Rhodoplanes elegans]
MDDAAGGMISLLVRLALGAALVYAGLVLVLFLAQRTLMYPAETRRTAPAAAGLPQAEEITLATADGERIVAWHVPPRGEKPVILYLHGNGGALRHRAPRFSALAGDGFGLLAVSFRGYGGSTGAPSEAGLIADAAA